MRELDQSVFDGQPPEVTLACVDYDGLLKFGKNVRNYRYTWVSERWRGADWVEQREGTDYKPLTSIRRKSDTPNKEVSGGVTPWGTGINVKCPACGGSGRYEPPETRCPYCDRIANKEVTGGGTPGQSEVGE